MFEAFPEEIVAVHKWNCGMLIKKKQRKLLNQIFHKWSSMASGGLISQEKSLIQSSEISFQNTKLAEELEILTNKENQYIEETKKVELELIKINKLSQSPNLLTRSDRR